MSINILCLHGYVQNNNIITDKINKLFGSKIKYNLIAPNGSYKIDDKFGWWQLPSKEHINIKHNYEDFDRTVDDVLSYIDYQEIDYIIGFSQGAVFATLLSNRLKNIKGIILISGSDIMDVNLIPQNKINIPCINIIGEKDTLCNHSWSKQLADYYEQSSTVIHKHGHVIPTSSVVRDAILDFITKNA